MRRLLSLLLVLPSLVLAACSSQDFYRGRVDGEGVTSAQALRVKDGAEQPVSPKYTVSGKFAVTAQSVKPYLTLDGDWKVDNAPSAAPVVEEPGAVLLRPLPPGAPSGMKTVTCDGKPALLVPVPAAEQPACAGGSCALPEAPPPAAVSDKCGKPVYRSPCSGEAGGTRVNNPSTGYKVIEPGTGWPCAAQTPGSAALTVGFSAVAYAVHVGQCVFECVKCVVAPLIP